MKIGYKAKDLIIMAFMVGLGIVLQLADNMLNFTGIPGGKLGLSNIVSLTNIFLFGGVNAVFIAAVRAVLSSLMFGGVSSLPYSLFGAVFSVTAMSIVKKYFYPDMSEVGISIIGAFFHNIVQVIVASIIFQSTALLSYSAPMALISVFAGFFTGVQVRTLNEKFKFNRGK